MRKVTESHSRGNVNKLSDIDTAPRMSTEKSRSEVIVEDLSIRVDKIRDSALDNLDTHFIAFNIRGDLAISNKATRDFFGFEATGSSQWYFTLSRTLINVLILIRKANAERMDSSIDCLRQRFQV